MFPYKTKVIKGKLDNLTIYTGAITSLNPDGTEFKTTKLLIDRLTKADAQADADAEIELIKSINQYPDSQF